MLAKEIKTTLVFGQLSKFQFFNKSVILFLVQGLNELGRAEGFCVFLRNSGSEILLLFSFPIFWRKSRPYIATEGWIT